MLPALVPEQRLILLDLPPSYSLGIIIDLLVKQDLVGFDNRKIEDGRPLPWLLTHRRQ